MKTNEIRLQRVARILRNGKGSDAAGEASPNAVSEEMDEVYEEYVARLPAHNRAIHQGQDGSERKAA